MRTRIKAAIAGFVAIASAAGLMLALAPSGNALPVYSSSCQATPFTDRGYLEAHPNYQANPAGTPCINDEYQMLTTGPVTIFPAVPSLHVAASGLNVTALHGVTSYAQSGGDASAAANATAAAVAVQIPGLTLLAHGVYSQASATLSGGLCNDEVTTGLSSVADLTINGKPINVSTGPIKIKLGLINVYINQTIRSGSTVLQRAIYIELFGTANDIAIAQVEAGVSC